MVLNRYNFDVEVASNGEMALEMFRENPKYDLILMVCYIIIESYTFARMF
jgi:DNA-binding response OmpR family regulator